MKKRLHKFRFCWYDLDANRHIVNTSYSKICVDMRMRTFREVGIDQDYFAEHQLGPVVLNEKMYFISEVSTEENLYVDIELLGRTADYKFFRLAQHIYDEDGEIVFYMTATIGIMDLIERKLIKPSDDFRKLLDSISLSHNYKEITKADLRENEVPFNKKITIPD